ncbi:MAG TPA: dTDP-4-dehydrorhamnose reductase [Longimicrobiales bacterium]|nr:dTDP-4-dehydrorhamnose reductase [Longimicrobiales bacterium]
MSDRMLIVGAAGQLGTDLVRAAGEPGGADVVGLSRDDLDLAATAAIAPAIDRHDFDLLINCAGFTRVDDAETDASSAVALNAHAVRELARACRRKGARFVTFSTDYVFDGRADRPYTEDAAPAPLNAYGASKLMGEALAVAAWAEGTFVIRAASLFGTGALQRGGGNFVETMIRAASAGRLLRVVDDITMSPTWTGHLARAALDLLGAGAPPGTYHLAGAGAATWYDFAVAALAAAGVEGEVEAVPSAAYPTPARRPTYSVLDCGRAAAAGVRLPPWRDGLDAYMADRSREPGQAAVRSEGP